MKSCGAALFDLDGTLYDRDQLIERLFAYQYDRFAAGLQGCSKAEYVRRSIELDEHGHRPKGEVYPALAGELGLSSERALERCGVEPDQAVFVGDNPDADVAGARRAGIRPLWKRVPYWHMPFADVHTIDRLTEILPVCLGPARSAHGRERTGGVSRG